LVSLLPCCAVFSCPTRCRVQLWSGCQPFLMSDFHRLVNHQLHLALTPSIPPYHGVGLLTAPDQVQGSALTWSLAFPHVGLSPTDQSSASLGAYPSLLPILEQPLLMALWFSTSELQKFSEHIRNLTADFCSLNRSHRLADRY